MKHPISDYMTPAPQKIGVNATLASARAVMNELGIRHLPVLAAGELMGIVSQRDIQLLETLRDVDSTKVTVEEAMTQDVLSVAPDAPLAEVARRMVQRKCGSAVITDGKAILGIFTTIDALVALGALLQQKPKKNSTSSTKGKRHATR
jgi:acetoin utilization protein AcuB